jgi:hypothetical protein
VKFRRAIEADLEREFGVWSAAQIELHNRRGVAWPTLPYDPTGRWATIQRHLLTHDGEHAFVAEDRARIAGFAAAMVRLRLLVSQTSAYLQNAKACAEIVVSWRIGLERRLEQPVMESVGIA